MNTTNSGATQAGTQDVVAVRHSFDGSGWLYADCGNGSDWLPRALALPDAEPLFDATPSWRPIADAPQEPGFTCDIWSASEQRRFTDCFWDKTHWAYEDFDCDHYRVRKVPDPVAFIPCPEAPDFGA